MSRSGTRAPGRLLLLVGGLLAALPAAAQPQIAVSPSSLSQALGANAEATQTLTVSNPGSAPLTFSFPGFGTGAATRPGGPVLELAKGETDPREGTEAFGSGGPDAFGYTWIDSDEPGGPAFEWVDISTTGTALPLGDDDFEDVPLPFAFPFYGQTYTSVRVTSNGFLTFSTGPGATAYTNQPIPSANGPGLFLAPYWDDLDPSAGGTVYAGPDGQGRFVVQYQQLRPFGSGTAGTYTFEAILDPSGVVLFQYLSVTGPASYGTVGIENAGGTTGLQIAFNAPYVRNGLAVRIAARPVWLAVSPASGTVAPGDSAEVAVTFRSGSLLAGTYEDDLTITNNTPNTPTYLVPVALTVASEPDVELSATALDFGGVFEGGAATLPLVVANAGNAPLTVQSAATSGPPFFAALPPGPATIGPGQSLTVQVKFEPTAPGPFSGTLTVASTDPDEPAVTVALSGEGLVAPDVAVSPSALSAALLTGQTTTQALTVANTGGSPLPFTVALRTGPGLGPLLDAARGAAGAPPREPLAEPASPFVRAVRADPGAPASLVRDSIYYDDGGPAPDGYYGWGGSAPTPFIVANRFTTGGAFSLNGVRVALRTGAATAPVTVEVYGAGAPGDPTSGPLLRSVTVDVATGTGALVEIPLGTALLFGPAQDFYIVVGIATGGYPIGADQIQGDRSYHYHNWFEEWNDSYATWVIRALSGSGGWLAASPTSGTVAPGGSLDLSVAFDAAGLLGGTYTQSLVVESNDPDEPEVVVPVTLDVTGVADIALDPDALAFGEVYVGATAARTFTVSNAGTEALTVSAITSSSGEFTAAPAGPFTLAPGLSQTVEVTFAPSAPGPIAATLAVASNDPDEPAATVSLAGTGLAAPDLAVSPDSLAAALATGQTTTLPLTVANTGEGPLTFAFQGFEDGARAAAERPARPAIPHLDLAKGAADPREGTEAFGAGGPDAFGYRWIDSDEPSGPSFVWNDIAATGTELDLFDDSSVLVPLPFTFEFYGAPFTSVRVASNGYLTFGSFGSDYTNDPIPTTYAPNHLVAPFWEDLNPSVGGTVHHASDASRFVVQYTGVPLYYDHEASMTFQVVLHADGHIEYHYLAMDGETETATVGIENGTGTDGLEVAFNAPYVHDSLTVRIATTPPWLAGVTPATGTVAPGGSVEVAVALDAAGLTGGLYEGALTITSNDPDDPAHVVPVALDVTGVPDVALSAAALDFGSVAAPGGTATRTVEVANAGTDVLTVSAVTADHAAYGVAPAGPFPLAAGQSRTLTVTFAPAQFGSYAAALTVASDDPDEPVVAVALAGEGTAAPNVAASPDSLAVTLDADSTGAATLTLSNTGDGPLEFSAVGFDVQARARATGRPARDAADPATPEPALAKGAADPRAGAESFGMGGPDAFGYHWADSNEPGGPAFAWVDISATGDSLSLSDDDAEVVALPFPFDFYGQTHTEVVVSSNGFLAFSPAGASVFTNAPIPRTAAPNEIVAPFWDDLNPGAGGTVYAGTDSLGRFVVQWDDVPRYGTNDRYTFEAILDPDGSLLFQYLAMQGPLLSFATVGIENKLGTDGLQIAFNAPYVHDALAVRISTTPPWVAAVEPASGTVAPGGSVALTVTFDAAGLESGVYTDAVDIQSNDPDTPLLSVPAVLTVTGDVLLPLRAGWNLVSWSVAAPDPAPAAVLAPILDRVLAVESFRGGQRRAWMPGRPDNTLTALEPTYSYWVRLSEPATLPLRGEPVAAQTPLALGAGPNAVAYLPTRASDIAHALAPVLGATTAASAFHGTGLTFAEGVPEAFRVLAQMEPKAGYVLHLTAPATLVYPTTGGGGGGEIPALAEPRPTLEGRLRTEREAGVTPTPAWVSVWGDKVSLPSGLPLAVGTRVTALDATGTVCGAFDVVAEGNLGLMAVYADDPYTPEDEGAAPGEPITLRFGEVTWPAAFTWGTFGEVVDLSNVVVAGEGGPEGLPTAFALDGAAPNPFGAAPTAIRYALPEPAHVRLVVYDLLGRAVATLMDEERAAGRHTVAWDGAGAAAGTYVVVLEAGDFRASARMTLVR